jgi:hypothetical protein
VPERDDARGGESSLKEILQRSVRYERMFYTLDFYDPREDAMGTEKQNAANRANAAQSTGPTSRQGKRQSALNSLNHSIYSANPTAIPRGHFKEDPDEIKRYVAGIVEALEPRDALEDAEASRVIHGDVFTPSQNTGNLEAHAEESAALAIEHTLERASRIDSRIARGLERALIVYYQLRKSRDSEVDTVEVLVESGTGSEGTLLGLQSSS